MKTLDAAAVRPLFRPFLGFNIATGLLLLTVFNVVRFALVLQANATGSYGLVAPVFLLMALTPVILLTPAGRRRIGLTRAARPMRLPLSLLAGGACCGLMIVSGLLLFGHGGDGDAFAYIARSYPPAPQDLTGRLVIFLVAAVISISFSPIGEELFYRGLVHECFRPRFGDRGAALIDAGAFALVHLAHFGLVWTALGWHWLPAPSLWWVAGLFLTGLVFSWARRSSGSIFGAVLAHMGFNLAMSAWIVFSQP